MFEEGSPFRLPLSLLVIGITFVVMGLLELAAHLVFPVLPLSSGAGSGLVVGGSATTLFALLFLWRRRRQE